MPAIAPRPKDRTPLLGLRPTTLALLLLFLISMDSLATILLLREEAGVELNPFMDWLLSKGELPFLVVRLVLAGVCASWIVRRAAHPYARVAAVVGFAIYLPVVALHIFGRAWIAWSPPQP